MYIFISLIGIRFKLQTIHIFELSDCICHLQFQSDVGSNQCACKFRITCLKIMLKKREQAWYGAYMWRSNDNFPGEIWKANYKQKVQLPCFNLQILSKFEKMAVPSDKELSAFVWLKVFGLIYPVKYSSVYVVFLAMHHKLLNDLILSKTHFRSVNEVSLWHTGKVTYASYSDNVFVVSENKALYINGRLMMKIKLINHRDSYVKHSFCLSPMSFFFGKAGFSWTKRHYF